MGEGEGRVGGRVGEGLVWDIRGPGSSSSGRHSLNKTP